MYLPLITTRQSLELFLGAVVLYLIAIAGVLINGLAWILKIGLLLLLVLNARIYIRRLILRSHPLSIVAFSKPGTFWILQFANAVRVNAVLKKNSLITPLLMVLNFEAEYSLRLTLLLTPRSITRQDYRRLMVYFLHCHKSEACI